MSRGWRRAEAEAEGQRVANLRMLHQQALAFGNFRKQGLHRFLRFIEKLRQREGDFGEAPVVSEASNVVRIMSIHKSKGLEFPVVFVSGLGGKLIVEERGAGGAGGVLLHRDLGVGMVVADVERNVFYPSVVSARIKDAAGRANRAEELRLLYVAMTRARDHLVLTGHVGKGERVVRWREQWKGHTGPLPEDVILKGQTALDWVMPAIAGGGALLGWRGACGSKVGMGDLGAEGVGGVVVTMHAPDEGSVEARRVIEDSPAHLERVRRIVAGEPLNDVAAPDEKVSRMIARVTGEYAHVALAREPAVRTVTALKIVGGKRGGGRDGCAAGGGAGRGGGNARWAGAGRTNPAAAEKGAERKRRSRRIAHWNCWIFRVAIRKRRWRSRSGKWWRKNR